MTSHTQESFLQEIIESSYRLLIRKLAMGGITAKNESAFQLHLAYTLKTLGELYEFKLDDKFHLEMETYITLNKASKKSGSTRARVDLIVKYQDANTSCNAAIELKFFKKENHREPNNRYDVFKDLKNLEDYKNNGIDLCYFILVTDHNHYVNQATYSADTADFDFRDGKAYKANTMLSYRTGRTEKPYGGPLSLSNDYHFNWEPVGNLNFLKVLV